MPCQRRRLNYVGRTLACLAALLIGCKIANAAETSPRSTAGLAEKGGTSALAAVDDLAPDLGPEPAWRAGLAAWRARAFARAASIFTAIAETRGLDGDDLAAASFWAARAAVRAQRPRRVAAFLDRAADASDGFYGLIAQRLMRRRLVFAWRSEVPPAGALQRLLQREEARRAIGFARAHAAELAEAEILALAGQIKGPDLGALALLAQRLGLPSAQMRLAEAMRLEDGPRHDAALFPVPAWRPATGFRVDRSLVLAIARAESAFDPDAVSPAGALGLMQVMPATARLVEPGLADAMGDREPLFDPATNLAIGQAWLLHLAAAPAIGRNLIWLLVAYNAGEGRLAEWLGRSPIDTEDPLFFIETIPLGQTRAYVKRVMAGLWAYRARFGQPLPSLQALAENRWPRLELPASSPLRGSVANAWADRP